MKKILTILSMLLLTLYVSAAETKYDDWAYVNVNGKTRQFILYVPKNVKPDAPLIISLHGTSCNAWDIMPMKKEVADQYGCIVAWPQGEQLYFPVFGGMANGWRSSGETSEDIDFFKAIIEKVNSMFSVDRKRIYCCGFSNGGMMTYTVANVASDIFAAFAAISGYPINEFHLHNTGRPVPFLHIHGKSDDFVRYAHVPTIVDNMVARNGCNPVPVKTRGNGYDKSVYEATDGSFPFVYYEIDGMGHQDFTTQTEDGSSAVTMWKFLSQYTLDTPSDTTLKWRPNIEAAGWNASNHGFTLNNGSTLLSFGGEQKTSSNQNVYHSLQMESGRYKLCLDAEGPAGSKITVQLKKITTGTFVLNKTIDCSKNIVLPYQVTDGWGEYQLIITRQNVSDNIKISNLEIYSNNITAGIASTTRNQEPERMYSLSGQRVGTQYKGLCISSKGYKIMR